MPRLRPRTSSHTLATWLARYTTACPAEFPAPTSATSCPAHSFAFDRRGPVVDAGSLEAIQVGDVEPAVPRPRGDHDRAGADTLVVDQSQPTVRAVAH